MITNSCRNFAKNCLEIEVPYLLQDIQLTEKGSEDAPKRIRRIWKSILIGASFLEEGELDQLIESRRSKLGIKLQQSWRKTIDAII